MGNMQGQSPEQPHIQDQNNSLKIQLKNNQIHVRDQSDVKLHKLSENSLKKDCGAPDLWEEIEFSTAIDEYFLKQDKKLRASQKEIINCQNWIGKYQLKQDEKLKDAEEKITKSQNQFLMKSNFSPKNTNLELIQTFDTNNTLSPNKEQNLLAKSNITFGNHGNTRYI